MMKMYLNHDQSVWKLLITLITVIIIIWNDNTFFLTKQKRRGIKINIIYKQNKK
jgi:hypothetical protein